MARKNAQPKSADHAELGLFRARDTFYWKGTVLVSAGDTVEAGHPMLKGREHLFTTFAPTFPAKGPQPLPVAEIPAAPADPDAGGDVPRGTNDTDAPAAPADPDAD